MSRNPSIPQHPDHHRLAAILLTNGRRVKDEILTAHQQAWTSDTAQNLVIHLDDRDLFALTVTLHAGVRTPADQWLCDLVDRENDRRDQAEEDWAAA